MDRIKMGVIGCGYWGPKLIRNFMEIPEASLEWVADLDPSRLEHVHSLYPEVHPTRDYHEMLASDVEAVAIATPVCTHHRLALDFLRAGKHVLVEKPLAACIGLAEEIVAEGAARQRAVMVGHTFVFNPAVVAIRQIVQSGVLGEIYYINAVRANLGLFQPDINVTWDLAPHDISIMNFIMAENPVTVSAHGGVYVQRRKGFHDIAYLSLCFPNGVLADIRVSWLDPVKIRQYTIIGSEKMLLYDDLQPVDKILLFDKGVEVPGYSDTEAEFHLTYRTGEGEPYPIRWVEPLKVECQHFLNCIRDGLESCSDGWSGLQVVRVLESAQSSLLNGGSREVIGESRGFCARRTRREVGPRCQDLCLREPVRL
jgi:predicted dehydrogenase